MQLVAHRLDLFRLCVNITIHGHADISVTSNLLQGFDIAALAYCAGEVAMLEYVSRCAMEVDGFFDAVLCIGVVFQRNRMFAADDEAVAFHGCKQFHQHRIHRDIARSFFVFGVPMWA